MRRTVLGDQGEAVDGQPCELEVEHDHSVIDPLGPGRHIRLPVHPLHILRRRADHKVCINNNRRELEVMAARFQDRELRTCMGEGS